MSASVLEKAVVSKFVVSYDEIRVVGCGCGGEDGDKAGRGDG